MEHRDSPGIEPEPSGEGAGPRRHFERLVRSRVRRVALPRLMVAGGLSLATFALLSFGVWRLLRSTGAWVDARPEHQIPFAQIELSPPPDPWVVGGTSRLLEEVRTGANLGETVSLLDLDLAAIGLDFQHCLWVKKVLRVDRSHYRRLIVEVVYRKPVAVVKLDLPPPNGFVIDEEAVVLPHGDIEWTSDRSPIRVRGSSEPLIEIMGLPIATPRPKAGLTWKRKLEGDSPDDADPMVIRAARLARFLQERRLATRPPRSAPEFASIHLPDKPDGPFFLLDSGSNWVCWGKAPGDEKPGEPSSEARWEMLLDWLHAHGPLVAQGKDCLRFTTSGASIDKGGESRKRKSGPRD